MPTRLQILRKEFMTRFAEEMAKLGFRKRSYGFCRKEPYGLDLVELYFRTYPGSCFDIDMYIAVRHDEVEECLEEYWPTPKELKAPDMTVGNSLDNMFGTFKGWRWTIEEERDVEPSVRKMSDVVRDVALPFFDRFSSLESVFDLFTGDKQEIRRNALKSTILVAARTVIIAYLLGRRDMFDDLVAEKKREVEQAAIVNPVIAEQIPQFDALVNDIRGRWENQPQDSDGHD